MIAAANEVRALGYIPVRVEMIPESMVAMMPEATVAMAPTLVANGNFNPETTQPMTPPPGARPLTLLTGELVPHNESTDDERTLSPWERGGAVEAPPTPQATMTLNAYGNVVARPGAQNPNSMPGAPNASPNESGRIERPAYSEGGQHERGLYRKFVEAFVYPVSSGVVLKELVPFYRQLAVLIGAGIPLYQSLASMEAQTKNRKLKEICRQGQLQVQNGGRFSEVMAAYPWIFKPVEIEMIRASEEGGLLDSVLKQIADYVEHELEIKRMISRETLYPKLVLFVALMLLGKYPFFSQQLAIVTLVVNGDGKQYLKDTVGFAATLLVPLAFIVVVCRLFLFNIPGVREGYDGFKLKIPVLGGIVKMFSLARFARTFSALYRGGFTMSHALFISGNASGNAVVQRTAHAAVARAERGEQVSDALLASGIFPPMALNMFRTGETSGGLDVMLEKLADFFEAEGKMKSHQAAMIFGVVVFLLVAILVAVAVISFYTGGAGAPPKIEDGETGLLHLVTSLCG